MRDVHIPLSRVVNGISTTGFSEQCVLIDARPKMLGGRQRSRFALAVNDGGIKYYSVSSKGDAFEAKVTLNMYKDKG